MTDIYVDSSSGKYIFTMSYEEISTLDDSNLKAVEKVGKPSKRSMPVEDFRSMNIC